MAVGGGLALKGVSLFVRLIQFCCAAIVLGIFCYFLATLHNHNIHIDTYIRAVTGISGAAVLYTIFALLLVCCLGGITFFSILGMLLDVAFMGAFIYVAYENRGGDGSCRGTVNTPFGTGNADSDNSVPSGSGGFTRLPSFRTACKLETACFAVSIVAVVFFFLSIFTELGLMRHHRKERAFGPSPNNGYTAGRPRRKFWQRKPKRDAEFGEKINPDALPPHTAPSEVRDSYATDATAVGNEPPINKYGSSAGYGNAPSHPATTNVMGSGANGYQTTTTHTPYHADERTYTAYNPHTTSNTTGTF